MDKEEKIQLYAKEIKNLEETNYQLKNELAKINNVLFNKKGEYENIKQQFEVILKENENLKNEKKLIDTKYQNQIKSYQAQIRRTDFFKETYRGSSKTKQLEMINEEVKSMRDTNKILCDFIKVIAEKLDFDEDIIKEMLQVSEGVDDPIIRNLIRVLTEQCSDSSATIEEDIKNIF